MTVSKQSNIKELVCISTDWCITKQQSHLERNVALSNIYMVPVKKATMNGPLRFNEYAEKTVKQYKPFTQTEHS